MVTVGKNAGIQFNFLIKLSDKIKQLLLKLSLNAFFYPDKMFTDVTNKCNMDIFYRDIIYNDLV